ncbi:MAG: BON domain-containing protein [Halomonas sp.]|uniref:BON domain-containing protein n=1 Tax=Halomonas sp. TaxID=1486246 RepID=UPI003F9AF116
MAAFFTSSSARRSLRVCCLLLLLLSIAYGFSADAAAGDATTARASNNVEQGDTGAAAPAVLPAPATISSEGTNNAQIETTPSPLKDNEIRQRISGIFSEIEGLGAIEVSVAQGVVILAGETANERKAQQAINLANRLTDVVTVDDQINRTGDFQPSCPNGCT